MENKVLSTKMTNFYPELGDMTLFGNDPFQNVVKSHLDFRTCEVT